MQKDNEFYTKIDRNLQQNIYFFTYNPKFAYSELAYKRSIYRASITEQYHYPTHNQVFVIPNMVLDKPKGDFGFLPDLWSVPPHLIQGIVTHFRTTFCPGDHLHSKTGFVFNQVKIGAVNCFEQEV